MVQEGIYSVFLWDDDTKQKKIDHSHRDYHLMLRSRTYTTYTDLNVDHVMMDHAWLSVSTLKTYVLPLLILMLYES